MHLRLVSYNIHKGIGGVDRRYDLSRVIHTIAHYKPDFALLQEVAQDSDLLGNDVQVEVLSEALGLPHVSYFPNVRRRRLGEYGNAILSRFPIVATTNVDLTLPRRKVRTVLHAEVTVTNGTHSRAVHLFNIHLGLTGGERKKQLATFLDCKPFAAIGKHTPAIVGGDFNDLWGTLGRLLEPAGFWRPGPAQRTFPAWGPVRALDSVYARGDVAIQELFASRIPSARRASDHLPLVAELRLVIPHPDPTDHGNQTLRHPPPPPAR